MIGIDCKKRSKYPVINIPFSGSSISKEHCRVLIDDSEHFIMDLGTKGKTKRRSHILKPNVYYELSDRIDLTLGELKCQYFTTLMSMREKEEEKKSVDETDVDLNETRSVNSDATATPSPRPAHSIQMSPPTLPSFDAGECITCMVCNVMIGYFCERIFSLAYSALIVCMQYHK